MYQQIESLKGPDVNGVQQAPNEVKTKINEMIDVLNDLIMVNPNLIIEAQVRRDFEQEVRNNG